MDFTPIFKRLKDTQTFLATLTGEDKNIALALVRDTLKKNHTPILLANEKDVKLGQNKGVKDSLIDRLRLTDSRLDAIEKSLDTVIRLPDPTGEVVRGWTTPAGLEIKNVRVPLGVVAVIYESRPNVTVDTAALCLKSGNAVLLRGSKSAFLTNKVLVDLIKSALKIVPVTTGVIDISSAIELVDLSLSPDGDHSDIKEILTSDGAIDVALPRGSAKLIKAVKECATVPVIETGAGVCHLFVDETADIDMALNIAENGKIQRPGVCNALEAILVHKNIAKDFLFRLEKRFSGRVIFHADERAFPILSAASSDHGGATKTKVLRADSSDEGREYLDLESYIKVVDNLSEAITYINAHNTRHSESIITKSLDSAKKFQDEVDASCVYVNASTRWTDGGEFGFGAELGISTQKLHVRGPMGLTALTTTKYLINGTGQIRG